MTFFYPDLSHYNRVTVQPSTQVVCAKGTHGTYFIDSTYDKFRQQTKAQGAFFFAYHWLNRGNAIGQANYCFDRLGAVPIMIDAEDMPGNTGYNGANTIADILNFANQIRARGGKCNLVYIPRWYWSDHMGRPALAPLISAGLKLVSSNYTTYSDNGPGWIPYGGMAPYVWQYTSSMTYGGGTCDFNACKDSVSNFIRTIGGDDVTAQEVWDHRFSGRNPDGSPWNFSAGEELVGTNGAIWHHVIPGIADLKGEAAKDAQRDADMRLLLEAIKSGGTSIDTAAILAQMAENQKVVNALSEKLATAEVQLAAIMTENQKLRMALAAAYSGNPDPVS